MTYSPSPSEGEALVARSLLAYSQKVSAPIPSQKKHSPSSSPLRGSISLLGRLQCGQSAFRKGISFAHAAPACVVAPFTTKRIFRRWLSSCRWPLRKIFWVAGNCVIHDLTFGHFIEIGASEARAPLGRRARVPSRKEPRKGAPASLETPVLFQLRWSRDCPRSWTQAALLSPAVWYLLGRRSSGLRR